MAGDRIVQWIVAVILEEAPLGPTVPARGAGAALLRRDDDDAVRGIGAVQRRGRRSLHDLDVLDLVGADVVGAIRLRTAGEEVRQPGAFAPERRGQAYGRKHLGARRGDAGVGRRKLALSLDEIRAAQQQLRGHARRQGTGPRGSRPCCRL